MTLGRAVEAAAVHLLVMRTSSTTEIAFVLLNEFRMSSGSLPKSALSSGLVDESRDFALSTSLARSQTRCIRGNGSNEESFPSRVPIPGMNRGPGWGPSVPGSHRCRDCLEAGERMWECHCRRPVEYLGLSPSGVEGEHSTKPMSLAVIILYAFRSG